MAINACTADFETGVNGATIATTDTGSATPWDVVNIAGAGNTVKYDNTQKHGGSLAAKIALGGTAGANYLKWAATHLGTANTNDVHYYRAYFYLPGGSPAAAWTIVVGNKSGSGVCYRIRINTSGKIELVNAGGSVFATSTTSVPAGAGWVRIEWQVTQSTNGGVVARLYFTNADAAAGSYDEQFGASTGNSVLTTLDEVWLGQTVSGPTSVNLWLDDLATSPTTWLGPAVTAAAFIPKIVGYIVT